MSRLYFLDWYANIPSCLLLRSHSATKHFKLLYHQRFAVHLYKIMLNKRIRKGLALAFE